MRSNWKFVYINSFFFRKSFILKLADKTKNITLWNKRMFIARNCLESLLKVYNGRKFQTIVVKKNMIVSVLGQFVLTKRITSKIHSKSDNKKKSASNKSKVVKSKPIITQAKTRSLKTKKRINLLEALSQDEYGSFNKSNKF